ncbi:MAG: AAA family ATPase [Alphaproteobacteria bacterium]|jgi:AAA+ superfamily predicted ATPase|nr:AAA family ATPase [Alphaproteobacteria bacterium]
MARSDLLVSLVKAGAAGNRPELEKTVEAIIAEERKKSHNILADRLQRAMKVNGSHATPPMPIGRRAEREAVMELTPRRTLNELMLPEPALAACRQLIEEQHRASLLRSHGLDPRHRLLLVGPPGNGKTTLAEAIAEAIAVPFIVVRYEAMIGSFLGETAGRLKRIFDYVRTTPCVLFFDEFDTIGKERGDTHETGEIKRVVSSLLMQVDILPSYAVVVAATNHPELLDRAVWRRFQLRLDLPAPSQAQLKRYVQAFLDGLNEKPNISADRIVKALGLVSYAEIEEFCLDIKRRHVLGMGEVSWKEAIETLLPVWRARGEVSAARGVDASWLASAASDETANG